MFLPNNYGIYFTKLHGLLNRTMLPVHPVLLLVPTLYHWFYKARQDWYQVSIKVTWMPYFGHQVFLYLGFTMECSLPWNFMNLNPDRWLVSTPLPLSALVET
jgi:hypothetical protein